jgi:hypothetical protein
MNALVDFEAHELGSAPAAADQKRQAGVVALAF